MKGMLRRAILLLTLLATAFPMQASTRNIQEVRQGDLIVIEGGWETRLTGIRCPTLSDPYGKEAYDFTRSSIEGNRVALFTLTSDNTATGIIRDEEGLPRGEIWFGENYSRELNVELLKQGLAVLDSTYLPDDKTATYSAAEYHAKKLKIGMWSEGAD